MILTWFRGSNGEWIQGEITPLGGVRDFEPWIVTAAPDGFLLADTTRKKGATVVVAVEGDGVAWHLAEDVGTGLSSILPEVIQPMCLCGWIRAMAPFRDGYIAVGKARSGAAKIWWSADGQTWKSRSYGDSEYWGIVGVGVIDQTAYAFGAAPAPKVWRSTDGQNWEIISDGTAFGLTARADSGVALFGMTADEHHLYALAGLGPPYGNEECPIPLDFCRQRALALFASEDGSEWHRVPIPEAMRWVDREASIAWYDGRIYIAEVVDGILKVWSTDDPLAVEVPPPDQQREPDRQPFVAVRLEYERYVDPVRVGVEPHAARSDDWQPLDIGLSVETSRGMAFIEASTSYLATDGKLVPLSQSKVVEATEDDPLQVSIEVEGAPLKPGLHEFDLSVPFWTVKKGQPSGPPDSELTFKILYNVFDEERIADTREFCDLAVRFIGGVSQIEELDLFDQLVTKHLEGELLEGALSASAELRADIPTGDYGTWGVVLATGDACGRYDLESHFVFTN